MKKRLKGLMSLMMAIVLVFMTQGSAFATISDSDYSSITDKQTWKVYISKAPQVKSGAGLWSAFLIPDVEFECDASGSKDISEYIGSHFSEEELKGLIPNGYSGISGWNVWSVMCASGEIECKVDKTEISNAGTYCPSVADYKAYGCVCTEFNSLYAPVISAALIPIDLTAKVYDKNNIEKEEISFNIDNYSTKTIPGNCQIYKMTYVYNNETFTAYPDNMERLWNIIEDKLEGISDIKLYEYAPLDGYVYADADNPMTESALLSDLRNHVMSNQISLKNMDINGRVVSELGKADLDKEFYNIEGWTAWKVPSGGLNFIKLHDFSESDTRTIFDIIKDSYGDRVKYCRDYIEAYNYSPGDNFVFQPEYAPINYALNVYDVKGNRLTDPLTINIKNFSNLSLPDCNADKWELIYDGDSYDIDNASDIWTKCIAVTGEEFDSDKAELHAICAEHISEKYITDEETHYKKCTKCNEIYDIGNHISDDGTIVREATETENGSKEFKCKICGHVIKNEIIPKLSVDEEDNNKDIWKKVISDIKAAKEGDKINIVLDETGILPGRIVEEIKGKDIDLVIDLENGIKWIINGKDVKNPKDVKLKASMTDITIPVEVINKITNETKKIQIRLEHDGEFGYILKMEVELGADNNGYYAQLFYYNTKTNNLEFMNESLIKDGLALLDFEHASDYIIVIDDKPYDSGNNDLPETYDYNATVFFLLALCAVVTAAIAKKKKMA